MATVIPRKATPEKGKQIVRGLAQNKAAPSGGFFVPELFNPQKSTNMSLRSNLRN
jgi:hypothetical protein